MLVTTAKAPVKSARTNRSPRNSTIASQVPAIMQEAFHACRAGRPGPVLIDLPMDVQKADIPFDIDTYEPLPVHKPAPVPSQISKAIDMLLEAERVVACPEVDLARDLVDSCMKTF